jgi:hypothetical protein
MRIKNIWRKPIHRFIVQYIRKCGGGFHTFPYGEQGKYTLSMSDKEYHEYKEYMYDKEHGMSVKF